MDLWYVCFALMFFISAILLITTASLALQDYQQLSSYSLGSPQYGFLVFAIICGVISILCACGMFAYAYEHQADVKSSYQHYKGLASNKWSE